MRTEAGKMPESLIFPIRNGHGVSNDRFGFKKLLEQLLNCIEGGRSFTAVLADNSSAEALAALLAKGDVTIRMEDYARMEKAGPLGTDLPRNDRHTTTSAGDLFCIWETGSSFITIPTFGRSPVWER